MKVILGVDAGGTKTAAAAYSPDGQVLAQTLTDYGNLLNNPAEACKHIAEAVRGCLQPGAEATHLYVGAAGIAAGDNKALLEKSLTEAFPFLTSLSVITDSHLTLYSLFEGKDGMLIISGTGSIGYAKRGESFHRFGGWGQLLADRGSGYDIVRSAIVAMLDDYDHARPCAALSEALLSKLQTDLFGVVKFFHSVPKGEIAKLLPVIARKAEEHDARAEGLLEQAGEYLAYMAGELYQTAGFSETVGLSVNGSVLEKIPKVRESFFYHLERGKGRFAILKEKRPATLGAVYLYQSEHRARL